ncbi:MAG: bifunctional DNA-formamidopyrimidine glycosylase/DNA-(apurinic or apyrimidinic site) lyase [Alphaproteobacteria bacterium]|nr:bifunctional DNA-formamidopyrimidine glycosylase/DNA-(apurinic or apyrimidinic site) lyase [Alphaproteobacteria bacterium]
MPELPEVETVRRGLAKAMEGRRINQVVVRRTDLRRPLPENFAEALTGRTITQLDRRAKYLLIRLDDATVVLAHLGMSGRMVIEQGTEVEVPARKHEHIAFAVGNGTVIRFSDPRRFGLMDLSTEDGLATHPLLASIGPEPLGDEFSGASLAARLKGRKTPIKSALLDQRIVAGLGNIYVCEGLFIAGVSPRRSAHTVGSARAERLVTATKQVLRDAIKSGGSTLRDHVTATGEMGYFQHNFKVYGREGEPCPTCSKPVQRIVQAGRSSFFRASCQR